MHIHKLSQFLFVFLIGCLLSAPVTRAQRIFPTGPAPESGNRSSFSFRIISGVKVGFSGSVLAFPMTANIGAATGVANRTYDDGAVYIDLNGDPTYYPTTTPTPAGQTKNWADKNSTDQVTADGKSIDFHAYYTQSADIQSVSKKAPSEGVEFAFRHDVTNPEAKHGWGLLFGFGGSSILSKNTQKVNAELYSITDQYSLLGNTLPAGAYSTDQGSADAIAIGSEPTRLGQQDMGPADLTTRMKVKGAYYTFRMGPYWFVRLGKKWEAEVGAGAALTVSGTRFTSDESLLLPTGRNRTRTSTISQTIWLKGFYGDVNLQWLMAEKTRLFIGGGFQSAGKYTQTDGFRTASVNLTSTAFVQVGIGIKF